MGMKAVGPFPAGFAKFNRVKLPGCARKVAKYKVSSEVLYYFTTS